MRLIEQNEGNDCNHGNNSWLLRLDGDDKNGIQFLTILIK